MVQKAPIESLVSTIRSPNSGPDIFVNEKKSFGLPAGLYAAFGGGLLGQSVTAATATVPPAFNVYSVQSTFLRPVQAEGDISYRVECTADGRSFSTRTVRATQGSSDKCIYVAIISFQRGDLPANNVLNYSISMPDMGGIRPGDISEEGVQHEDGESLRPNARDDPFDWRMLEGHSRDELTESRQLAFVRSPAVSSDNASVHLAALVYLSDTYMLAAALNANPETIGEKIRDVAMGASLTHNVSLHDPTARIDEWLLSERDTSWGSDGRVLVHQRLWNVETGRLVMSGTQEGLIRLKPNKL